MLDDIIVWWVDEDRFDVMPNASNTARVVEAVGGERRHGRAGRCSRFRAPRPATAWPSVAPRGRGGRPPRPSPRSRCSGHPCVVAGTGYTGEDGVELAVPRAHAAAVWDAVVATGVTPAGLGARDTLRLEAGLPLHGHELGPGITPLQAGLGWVVAWGKGDFQGYGPLAAERERGVDPPAAGPRGRRPPPAPGRLRACWSPARSSAW